MSISGVAGRVSCVNGHKPGPGRSEPSDGLENLSEKENEMVVQPYLNLDGRCEEAIEFYRKTLGAEVQELMRFKDSPEPPQPGTCSPGDPSKVMHASLRIGDSIVMASDCRCEGRPAFQGFSLCITAPSADRAERLFAALSEGGAVQMPMAKTFFSPRFGVVSDRFGVSWMIYVAP